MMIYTLIGSLLMLVGAIATAIVSAHGGHLTFSIEAIQHQGLPLGSQRWIFWFFAAAFLVKMPAFLVHGWMPDAYRAAPLPVLVVFSGVLAKVGAYGFLRVVLPLFPAATAQFQTVILLVALASILYGSVMAFTQTNVHDRRLSSVARSASSPPGSSPCGPTAPTGRSCRWSTTASSSRRFFVVQSPMPRANQTNNSMPLKWQDGNASTGAPPVPISWPHPGSPWRWPTLGPTFHHMTSLHLWTVVRSEDPLQ